jgi:hypothetical protein
MWGQEFKCVQRMTVEYLLLGRHCTEHKLVSKTDTIPALKEMKYKQKYGGFFLNMLNKAIN